MNSLREAYTLAHSAQCRLNLEASRPDRNLRFVVGHLMHYESLRLRIVEIEHDISKSARASQVAFKGTGHVDHRLQHKPSPLGRKSPPPPPQEYDDDDDEDDIPDDFLEDDEDTDGLSLSRFPSGAARQQQPPPPELDPDNSDEDDDDFDDEPRSPEEPDEETLARCVKGDGNELMATMYESVRKCSCHGKTDSPSFDRVWELPPDKTAKQGVTRVVAQMRDDNDKASQLDHTAQPVTASA